MHKAGFATLSELDAVFTDQPLPRSLAASCADWNTWVALAI
jgi:DeoR family glycerol-3-phosphate regulon repressor